jgi:CRP-like cAMP-binding protein
MATSSQQATLLDIVRAGLALSADDAAAVTEELEPVTCRGGAWLFRQGDAADSLYLLVRGRLQVWIDSSDPGRPEPRMVAEVAPGETVGEIGLLTGGVRSAGIRALRAWPASSTARRRGTCSAAERLAASPTWVSTAR